MNRSLDIGRTPRVRASFWLSVITAGAILVAGCSSEPTEEDTSSFKDDVNALVLSPGDVSGVPKIDESLVAQYGKYSLVDGRDGIMSDNAVLSGKPKRFETYFSAGDGSGADTVCVDVEVPAKTKYVLVVKNSDKDVTAWLDSNNEDKSELHLCFDPDEQPSNVMAWYDNTPR